MSNALNETPSKGTAPLKKIPSKPITKSQKMADDLIARAGELKRAEEAAETKKPDPVKPIASAVRKSIAEVAKQPPVKTEKPAPKPTASPAPLRSSKPAIPQPPIRPAENVVDHLQQLKEILSGALQRGKDEVAASAELSPAHKKARTSILQRLDKNIGEAERKLGARPEDLAVLYQKAIDLTDELSKSSSDLTPKVLESIYGTRMMIWFA